MMRSMPTESSLSRIFTLLSREPMERKRHPLSYRARQKPDGLLLLPRPLRVFLLLLSLPISTASFWQPPCRPARAMPSAPRPCLPHPPHIPLPITSWSRLCGNPRWNYLRALSCLPSTLRTFLPQIDRQQLEAGPWREPRQSCLDRCYMELTTRLSVRLPSWAGREGTCPPSWTLLTGLRWPTSLTPTTQQGHQLGCPLPLRRGIYKSPLFSPLSD